MPSTENVLLRVDLSRYYLTIYVHTHTHTYIYIYIERERERAIHVHMRLHIGNVLVKGVCLYIDKSSALSS